MGVITESDYQHWRTHGYVVVKLLDDKEVEEAVGNVYEYMPSWEDYASRPRRYEALLQSQVRTLGTFREFPFVGDALTHGVQL